MQRGEIWWASLGLPRGSEPGYRRPVVIVQSNEFNRSRINTVIVAVITSNLRLADAPGNVQISGKGSGLNKPSVINVSQLATLDKAFLTGCVGKLTAKQIQRMDEGLKLVLSLS
jgi:mRNA interferase MazF